MSERTETETDNETPVNDHDNNNDSVPTSGNGVRKTIRVAVGSKNPVKINAVKLALERVMKSSTINVQVEVQGFDVPSDVPDQPFGDVSLE